ncbi:uncharacterized protein K489DRAFT_369910 [Dissoconium aciculare CBS 342.82]|uniref:Uncharacterized protein n=1 Tax=Dissoconium aciculare CBS 342.82 TaxID=1314786 RepID=A0A6J3M9T2_9PEZI|nr:uncharacterized protein K489DRAFT_369910 [Dissoconium aciculare CBS 342.82]KAF1823572.1 hypothetical protein K489DRAFT_369910 [Dissoconium aciculare CBS 342.82]
MFPVAHSGGGAQKSMIMVLGLPVDLCKAEPTGAPQTDKASTPIFELTLRSPTPTRSAHQQPTHATTTSRHASRVDLHHENERLQVIYPNSMHMGNHAGLSRPLLLTPNSCMRQMPPAALLSSRHLVMVYIREASESRRLAAMTTVTISKSPGVLCMYMYLVIHSTASSTLT